MNKRTAERIAVSEEARFFQGTMFYSGTVLDLSVKGMFIQTNTCLFLNSKLIVLLFSGNKLLEVTARVKRVRAINHHCDGMGVEILNSPEEYTKFVNELSTWTDT